MTIAQTDQVASRTPLRLWPGVIAAVVLVLARYVLGLVNPDFFVYAMLGSLACAAAIALWWLFFSRAPWIERLGAFVVLVMAFYATRPFLDKSITDGMMGMMFAVYALPPVVAPAFVAWAVATRRLSDGLRRATMVATIFLACGVWLLLRTDGIMGSGSQIAWRFVKTPEQRLLATADDLPATPAQRETTEDPKTPAVARATDESRDAAHEKAVVFTPASAAATTEPAAPAPPTPTKPAEWPGFRGPNRDGVIRGERIETDWSKSAPVEMWRRPVGPGWSSFAVNGDLLYTQEQRGEEEVVACYRVSTGKPVWRHSDATRFWESNAGAGPRGTPTLSNGRVYALGATGILNALDARSGAVVWSRNVASDTKSKVPEWGFSSSPLVIDDIVIVAASGKLAGYDVTTGNLRWSDPSHGGSYSSPHRSTIDGVAQVLLLNSGGATSVAPATGKLLWEHPWKADMTVVQPSVIGDGDVLISASTGAGGMGIRRLAVAHGSGGWTVEERWTSNGLKPYFNDYVVHKGHAYGFDGNILSCIDLQDGQRRWKGGRYGNGQLVLLTDQDLLLVSSEEGELALVSATPEAYKEIARIPGLEGKNWNHPVVVRDVLLVRNDHEMAAFRLSVEGR